MVQYHETIYCGHITIKLQYLKTFAEIKVGVGRGTYPRQIMKGKVPNIKCLPLPLLPNTHIQTILRLYDCCHCPAAALGWTFFLVVWEFDDSYKKVCVFLTPTTRFGFPPLLKKYWNVTAVKVVWKWCKKWGKLQFYPTFYTTFTAVILQYFLSMGGHNIKCLTPPHTQTHKH